MSTSRFMTGPFMTGLRVTLRTMPEFGSPAAVAVQTLAAPAFTALFYLLLSRSGQGQSEAGGAGATLAALVGSCAVQTVTLVASTLSEDRYEGTLPHELVAAGTGVRSWAGRFAAMLLVALLGGLASLAATFAATPADAWPGGTPLALLPAALALTAVSCLASLGMGLCIAALSLACTDALFPANLAGYLLPIGCGLVAPAGALPQPWRALAYTTPIAWTTDAARAAAAHTTRALACAGVGIAVGAAWVLAAVVTLRLCRAVSRRHDTIAGIGL